MLLKLTCKIAITLFFLHGIVLSSCFSQNLPFQGQINEDNINIRSDSTVGSEIICRVNKGEKVEVLSQLYDWYKIRLPNQAPCYVRKDLLECTKYDNSPIMRCISVKAVRDRINVRLKPDESSPILGRMDKDETANIIKSQGDWYKIEPAQNSYGWISKIFITEVLPKIDKRR